MKVTFWGVRGSIPAPGPETNRYGGNTSCVTVESKSGKMLILDAGTGMAVLGRHMMEGPFGKGEGRASIVLGHPHWDHIQGFPFFAPVFVPGNFFDFYGHSRAERRLENVLEGQMSPKFSPVQSLKNLGASIRFYAIESKQKLQIEEFRITGIPVPHGVTTSLALRIEETYDYTEKGGTQSTTASHAGSETKSMVYVSDVGYPEEGISGEIIDHYSGADLLIHDCTYSPEDYEERRNRGFSSINSAAEAACAAKVKHLVMFHYDQDYSDEKVDVLRDRLREKLDNLGGSSILLTPAAEGLSIQV